MRRALVIAAVVAVVAVGVVLGLRPAHDKPATAAGRVPPPLPAKALTGTPVTLAKLRGKPALINYWAAWCGPCKHEAPELRALSRSLHGRARVIGVDWNDDSGDARAFARSHGWTYPLLSDPSGTTGDRWGIRGLPTTFVLDAQGRIVRTLHGAQTLATLRSALGHL